MASEKALKKLEGYLDTWFDGKQVKGLRVTPETVYRCQEIYSEIVRGCQYIPFIEADVRDVLTKCGIETVVDGIGWRVKC